MPHILVLSLEDPRPIWPPRRCITPIDHIGPEWTTVCQDFLYEHLYNKGNGPLRWATGRS